MINGEPNKLKTMFSVIGWTYQNKTDPNFAISIASTYGILTHQFTIKYQPNVGKFWNIPYMDDMIYETGKLNICASTWASYHLQYLFSSAVFFYTSIKKHIVELQATTELILENIRDLEVLGTNLPQGSYTFWEW